jgi:hypothetical protein
VAEQLDIVGGESVLDNYINVEWHIIPVEKPLLLKQRRLLFLQLLHQAAQDLDGEDDFYDGTHDVHVDEALAIEEGLQHLLCPT